MRRCLLLFFLFLMMALRCIAQTDSTIIPQEEPQIVKQTSTSGYFIKGVIKDGASGEGIPFATIFFPKSNIGATADLDGNFELKTNTLPNDTLQFGAIGYQPAKRLLNNSKRDYAFYIELSRSKNELQEFVFHAGEDPAITLVKNIIAHKPQNDPDRMQNYRYEVYNKLEVDIDHLTKEEFEKLPVPMLKQFSFIYENWDTVSGTTPFLPFYFTETLSDYYFRRSPKKQKEFIRASRLRGVKNESIMTFLGSTYQNLNAYDNFIPVFEKSFISPVSANALLYYKYKIKDTQQAYGRNIILVQFTPRRTGELCFYGDFWVADSVFALQRISMEASKDANINWVRSVSVYQEFAPLNDADWFRVKDKFVASFTLPYNLKLPGFIGRKTTSYAEIRVNNPVIDSVLDDPKSKLDVVITDTARHSEEAFWASVRHDSLSENERAINQMIDTLEHLPAFIRFKNLMKFVTTGKFKAGILEVGPLWNIYSSNPVEGKRFRLSLGTTPKLFKDVYFNGHIAYGTRDERFKFGINGLWILNRSPRTYLFASYLHDLDRSNTYYDGVSNDNAFSNIVRKPGVPWRLVFVKEQEFGFFKEYLNGFSHELALQHRDFNPYAPLPSTSIFKDGEGASSDRVVSTEANIRLRYAFKERFLEGNYHRVSLGSLYPIVELRYAAGFKSFLGGNYDYQRVTASVSDNVKVAPLGILYWNVYAGKYFGTLPYPLLEVHPGNPFYYYNKHAFNLMQRYEFVSDQYAGINVEHDIGGGIFNYIPLVKKAKFRQFWTGKLLYGSLNNANAALNLNKGYSFRTLSSQPYIELGTGVSNILQIFRIDFIWRVSPAPLPTDTRTNLFGIFGSLQFKF